MPKKISRDVQRTGVNGAGGALVTYAAMLAAQKWTIPVEIAAVVVGSAFGFMHRLAKRWLPD